MLVLLAALSLGAFRLAQTLQESSTLRTLGYVGIFLLTMSCSATLFLPIPSWGAIGIAGGFLHPVLVGICAGAGSATGELTGYFAGRGGRLVLGKRAPGWAHRIESAVRERGFLALYALAAIPNPAFDVAGLTAGAIGYSPIRYWLAVWLGKSTIYILIAMFGEAILARIFGAE
jgi:membrane protein YqaA with SNARE-associated domain